VAAACQAIAGPLAEASQRPGAWLAPLVALVHKIGDTLANLTFRLLFNEQGYTNDEIALYDVGFGFWAYLVGIFLGGVLFSQMGLKRSVLLSLWLMAISNLSFAGLAAIGHNNWAMAAAICFENLASGIGGVTVVAYFSALCDLRYTASQYALISAAASVVGRVLTGTTAGWLIETFGYVNFYLLTTVVALPGILLFWLMMRRGFIDASVGSAATTSAEAAAPPRCPASGAGRWATPSTSSACCAASTSSRTRARAPSRSVPGTGRCAGCWCGVTAACTRTSTAARMPATR
jgi:PAT family beta-lactamase induction signal transducer AmpG